MKLLASTFVLLLVLLFSTSVHPAVLSWSAPGTYTDGTVIGAEKVDMFYKPYTGPTQDGPWTAHPDTPKGALSTTLPDPAEGQTMWYTVSASLGGQEGAKAGAVSKTTPFPIRTPDAPQSLSVE